MKSFITLILFTSLGFGAAAQIVDTITNAGFERWGNTVPSGDANTEPTNWYSDQSGGGYADLGPQTCFKSTTAHSGSYSVQVITESSILAGAVNGVVTTGVVNAPTTTKSDGYIGTINSSTPSDIRRMRFTGRPDSIVGWYQYTPGAATERAKVRAILHIGNYFDPETPTTYHPNPIDSQVASALFYTDTPGTTVSTWTRFSVPFIYTSGAYASDSTPDYIMINVTPSANQATTVTGSALLLDDLGVAYAVPDLTVTGITTTSAVLNWTEPGVFSAGSEYVITTTAGTPTGSGTMTTGLTYTATGLTPATTYYASVRDSCLSGAFSNWVTAPFTTSGTSAVKNVTNHDFSITAYPNPVGNELTINITGAASTVGQVQLIDISGRLISTTVANASAVNLSMNGLPSGIYLIRYIDAEHTQTIKINKE